MKGDFSRQTFDRAKHYRAVLLQQGRVQLDADWNEQQEIQLRRNETEGRDVIGRCGAPGRDAGFGISHTLDGKLDIGPGRYYVDGILCENEAVVPFTRQPDYPEAKLPTKPGFYLAYLEVWQRHITAVDDPHIRETALGGPDTATRVKTVWQVKLLELNASVMPPGGLPELTGIQDKLRTRLQMLIQSGGTAAEIAATKSQLEVVTRDIAIRTGGICHMRFSDWDAITAQPSGTLTVRAQPTAASDEPCLLPPNAGYRRLENQLYRVEIHKKGAAGEATFKWSRDNGSFVFAIEKEASPRTFQVNMSAFDSAMGLRPGETVEVSDDHSELGELDAFDYLPGALVKVQEVDRATQRVTVNPTPPPVAANRHAKLRRWNSDGDIQVTVSTDDGDYLDLEDGIQVKFSKGEYKRGDYWLIPARTATGNVEWPPFNSPNDTPTALPPMGIDRHFCRLALVELSGTRWRLLDDCRKVFTGLTEDLRVKRVVGKNAYGQDGILENGMVLPGSALTQGLQVALNQEIDPASAGRAACSLSVEVPYLLGETIVGFQPIILAAKVTGDSSGFLNWTPEDGAAKFLATKIPWATESLPDTPFARDWDTFQPPNITSNWQYSGAGILGHLVGAPLYHQTSGAMSVSRSRLKENAASVGLSAVGFKSNSNYDESQQVGLVFNYLGNNDMWLFIVDLSVMRSSWGDPAGSKTSLSVVRYKDDRLTTIVSHALEGTGGATALDEIALGIKQAGQRLSFAGEVKLRRGEQRHTKTFTVENDPVTLVPGSGFGPVIRLPGQARFTRLAVSYPDAYENIIPPASASRLLSHLTVRPEMLRPRSGRETSPPAKPRSEFHLSFWLLPRPAYSGYAYGQGGVAIGGDRVGT